jgi:hypothetical protein
MPCPQGLLSSTMIVITTMQRCHILERAMGFEPTTICLEGRSSTPELHPQFLLKIIVSSKGRHLSLTPVNRNLELYAMTM